MKKNLFHKKTTQDKTRSEFYKRFGGVYNYPIGIDFICISIGYLTLAANV